MPINGYLDAHEWKSLKMHFRRTKSLNVALKDRRTFRNALNSLRKIFPNYANSINATIASTLQWSSCVIEREGKFIAIVDFEQANAINFLLYRQMMQEYPIYSYVEYAVRASECLIDLGREEDALAISYVAQTRLVEFAKSLKSFPNLLRPIVYDDDLSELLNTNFVLIFVVGHEIGHLFQRAAEDAPLLQWVSEKLQSQRLEPSRYVEGGSVFRFIKPLSIIKFDDNLNFAGDVVLGTRLVPVFSEIRRRQALESHADAIGVCAVTLAASNTSIKPEKLFLILFSLLEHAESLMILKRTMPLLPSEQRAVNVTVDHPHLSARRAMLISLVEGICENEVNVGEKIAKYWQQIDRSFLRRWSEISADGSLESVSNRLSHLVRGGLRLGLEGNLPAPPSSELLKEKYGSLAGEMHYLASHLTFPHKWFKIEATYDWTPSEVDEPVCMGFGGAVRDISNALARGAKKTRAIGLSPEELIRLARLPRSMVSAQHVEM